MSRKEFTRQKMDFGDALNADSNLTPTAHRVARQLIKHLNSESGLAWPGAERLATDFNVSVRSVRRAIAKLTQPGGWFIKVQHGGRGRPNHYAMNTERVTTASRFENASQDESMTILSEKGDKIVRKRVTATSPKPFDRTLSKNPTPAASRSDSDAGACDGLQPETKNARQEKGDKSITRPFEAMSQYERSNVVADRKREKQKGWDLGLTPEQRASADDCLKRLDFS